MINLHSIHNNFFCLCVCVCFFFSQIIHAIYDMICIYLEYFHGKWNASFSTILTLYGASRRASISKSSAIFCVFILRLLLKSSVFCRCFHQSYQCLSVPCRLSTKSCKEGDLHTKPYTLVILRSFFLFLFYFVCASTKSLFSTFLLELLSHQLRNQCNLYSNEIESKSC